MTVPAKVVRYKTQPCACYKQNGGLNAGFIITVPLFLGLERTIARILLQNCHFLLEL